jgi:acyl carrier protein
MFSEIGVLWLDHVAVTTETFDVTAQHYLSMPNARVLRGPGWNSEQKVHFIFVNFGGDLCIEILGVPHNGDSPIAEHARAGGGAYHLCHAVADINISIVRAQELGARLIIEPIADEAYDGRRVAFLIHPAHGLFELVEAYGSFRVEPFIAHTENRAVNRVATSQETQAVNIDIRLKNAFEKIFRENLPKMNTDWTVNQIEGWDSLQHIRLIMEVERQFDVSLPSHILGSLCSYDDIAAALTQVAIS